MTLNVECKLCRRVFDATVGIIAFKAAGHPEFEYPPVCPECGELTKDDIQQTELGLSQLTEVFSEPRQRLI